MLGFEKIPYIAPREAVPTIHTVAYNEAVQKTKDALKSIPNLNSSPYMYTKRDGYRSFTGIKGIKQDENIVRLKYSEGAMYLEGSYTGSTRIRSISNKNLPASVINPCSTALSTKHRASANIWNDLVCGGVSINYGLGSDSYKNTVFHSKGISGTFNTEHPY